MARIEKTVFISYRRADVYTALAVYENLKDQGYDIFFDYRSISSGDFEQIIASNIRARAHFLLILTQTALDRCNEPGDWLRREIELAIDEKRNIIPLFFKGFRFGTPAVSETLTGKLKNLSRYNGLNVHEDYFDEAMQRLRTQYLNIPLETVLHPVSTEVQRVVRAEQIAADKALEQIVDVKELVKHPEEIPTLQPNSPEPFTLEEVKRDTPGQTSRPIPWKLIAGVVGGLIVLTLWGSRLSAANQAAPTATNAVPTQTLSLPPTFTAEPKITPTPATTDTIRPSTLTPTLGVGSTLVSDMDGMVLLYVPAGKFQMGSNTGSSDEQPLHTVNLDAFWIDQSEVTNHMYTLCVEASVCQPPKDLRSITHNQYYGNPGFDNYPVIQVDWNMAQTYCAWAGRRLPTEAQWEKAARGIDGNLYSWGNDAPNDKLLNYNGNVQDTGGVKSYEAGKSPYGAYDMLGNVWEWVNDWYDPFYYQSPPLSNPEGPATGTARVHRGGSWRDDDSYISAANRDSGDPTYADFYLGIRCALSATP
jgi:formylglycine-generating enzyme required for sulfatase activity